MQDEKVIQAALLVSLLLHLLLAAATWRLPLYPAPDPAQAEDRTQEVEMIILPDEAKPEAPEQAQMPTAYTEVPERLASETPPEHPDYLAMHHSLAADNVLGGDGETPTADEEWIAEQVRIREEALQGGQGVTFTEQVPPPARRQDDQVAGNGQEQKEKTDSEQSGDRGRWSLADPSTGPRGSAQREADTAAGIDQPQLEQWWGDRPPSILKQGQQGDSGDRGFDFNQAAKGKVTSGVAFDQDFSLNTYQWDYAPWMHRFTNELYRHWVPPYAYRLGVIDGRTVVRLVVALDGRIKSLEVIDTEGHSSLHDASVAALKAFAPYAPLPAHFPEENLVITLGLYYPALRR